jgi:hypothetical protein
MRDADVTEAIVQNVCATTTMKSMNSAQRVLVDSVQISVTMPCPAPRRSSLVRSGIANVTATSRMNPKITDTTTAITIPQAAESEARLVSSLMCADASKPVIVYWAMARPVMKT